jgi:hypothetical protein
LPRRTKLASMREMRATKPLQISARTLAARHYRQTVNQFDRLVDQAYGLSAEELALVETATPSLVELK